MLSTLWGTVLFSGLASGLVAESADSHSTGSEVQREKGLEEVGAVSSCSPVSLLWLWLLTEVIRMPTDDDGFLLGWSQEQGKAVVQKE